MDDLLLLQRLSEINSSVQDLRKEIRHARQQADIKFATKEFVTTISEDVSEIKDRTSWLYTKVIGLSVILPVLATSSLKNKVLHAPEVIIEKVLKREANKKD